MFTLLSIATMVGEVISLPHVHFETATSSENHTHLPVQRHWRHDPVDTLASDYLGSRETEDCASPGDRVHVHQPRAPEIADNASSFQRHLEDDFSPTPSWLEEIDATQPGKAPHLELQPIQIASPPIAFGIVVEDPIAQPASTPIPTSLVINDPTTQPAPGPTAGEVVVPSVPTNPDFAPPLGVKSAPLQEDVIPSDLPSMMRWFQGDNVKASSLDASRVVKKLVAATTKAFTTVQ
ncbi:hypothetical protein TrCOL_g6435, partial [Triparma columacea]